MIKFIKSALRTHTIKNISVTMTTTALSGILGILFYLINARYLSTQEFAVLTLSISFITIAADSLELGLNSSLIRFLPDPKFKHKQLEFVKTVLLNKIFIWSLVLVFGFWLVPGFATDVLNQPNLTSPLRLSLLGVGSAMLFAFSISVLQSFQQYKYWGMALIFGNLFRFIFVVVTVLAGVINIYLSLSAYIIFPLVGFILFVNFINIKHLIITKSSKKEQKALFSYGGWIGLTMFAFTFGQRIDNFINAHFLTLSQVGIYSLAAQITLFISQVITALEAVISVRFSSLTSLQQMRRYLFKVEALVISLCVGSLIFVPISWVVIPLLLGNKYVPSLGIFNILFLSALLSFISIPFQNVLKFYFKKSHVIFSVYLFQLIFEILAAIYLVQKYGITGTAWAVLIADIFGLVIWGVLVWFYYQSYDKVLEVNIKNI